MAVVISGQNLPNHRAVWGEYWGKSRTNNASESGFPTISFLELIVC